MFPLLGGCAGVVCRLLVRPRPPQVRPRPPRPRPHTRHPELPGAGLVAVVLKMLIVCGFLLVLLWVHVVGVFLQRRPLEDAASIFMRIVPKIIQ